jgi:hypothetical protein
MRSAGALEELSEVRCLESWWHAIVVTLWHSYSRTR